ncbi:MAG: hypothetical protein QNK05_15595 [Myxococcota bacterium]|nr:hypothetical protein [Myxococcota bacterium]
MGRMRRWWRRLWSVAGDERIVEATEMGKRALELQILDKPDASVTRDMAEAASALLAQLDQVDQAAIHVGSLLILRTKDARGAKVIVKTLSPMWVTRLEQNPHLLDDPTSLARALEQITAPQRSSTTPVDAPPSLSPGDE